MDAWVIEGGGVFDALICKRARVKLKDSYWYSVFNLLYFFSPFHSQEVVCGREACEQAAQEQRQRLIYMCPGGNKPVSLSSGSYVTGGRAEGWPQWRFMASSNPTCQGNWPMRQLRWEWRIGFVPLVYNYPTERDTDYLAISLSERTGLVQTHRGQKDRHDKHVGILQSNSGLVYEARKGPKIWPSSHFKVFDYVFNFYLL